MLSGYRAGQAIWSASATAVFLRDAALQVANNFVTPFGQHLFAGGEGYFADHALQLGAVLVHELRKAPQRAGVGVHAMRFDVKKLVRVLMELFVGQLECAEQFFIDQPVADRLETVLPIDLDP